MKPRCACALAGIWFLLMIVELGADALILKDGRRVEGQLIGVRDGVIEFEQRGARGGRERVMIDRVDVRRIELDDGESDRGDQRRRAAERFIAALRLRELPSLRCHARLEHTGIDACRVESLLRMITSGGLGPE